MNKGDLIDKIAAGAGISKAAAGTAIDTAVDSITAALRKGERVAQSVGVEQLAGREAAVVFGNAEDGPGVEIAAVRPVLVRVDGGLGTAGGTAGPEPEGGLVGGRVGCAHRPHRRFGEPLFEAPLRVIFHVPRSTLPTSHGIHFQSITVLQRHVAQVKTGARRTASARRCRETV